MIRVLLCVALLPVAAWASPRQQLSLAMPLTGSTFLEAPSAPPPASRYEPAPLPNREVAAPPGQSSGDKPRLAPTLFTRRTQFRGDGFSPGSTAQEEQDRNLKPTAGFLLQMPLEPSGH